MDVTRVAERVGIRVTYELLEDSLSGKITKVKDSEDKYYITINGLHHPNRQRFTIGHELAHFFLHKSKIGDGIEDNSLYRSEKINNLEDVEANRFSAKLLMPMELILEVRKEGKLLGHIANELKVSKSALRVRLGIPY